MSGCKFFFNHECLPTRMEGHTFQQRFELTLRAYDSLLQQYPQAVEKGIITESLPSNLRLNHGPSVADLMNNISHTELRRLAYFYFTRYPMESILAWEESLDEAQACHFSLGDETLPAFFAYLVAKAQQFAFTVACHPDLEVNQLELHCPPNGNKIALPSLYGAEENKQWIGQQIEQKIAAAADNWGKLLLLLGPTVSQTGFEKDFKALSQAEQTSILTKFGDAQARGMATPLAPDTKIIKEVSADEKKPKVCELRVFGPVALRVYYCEKPGTVYLLSIHKKSNPDQKADIAKAQRTLEKLLLIDP